MAKILVVIEEGEQTYYLCEEGDEQNTSDDSAEWGMPLDFNGVTYMADVDSEGEVLLYTLMPVAGSDFEAVADDDDSDDEGEEEESEDEEEGEPVAE